MARVGPGLVGRIESRDFLLNALAEGTRVAVVLGGPGTGKSALLDAVAAGQRRQGVRVVEVTGRPLESALAFSTLLELLSPLGADVREDVLAALPADPLRLRLDVLRRVEDAAGDADMGLLILVDDAQWIDASSLSVLAFVANRIVGSTVAMVVAARGDVAPLGFAAHPVVPLPLLDIPQSRLVLRRTGLDLDETLTSTIVTTAAGNPLALLELARAAAAGRLTRVDPMLPMSDRLERAFAAELPDLPDATRELLVLVAAGADDLASLSQVSGPVDVLADLQPAERCGLLTVAGQRIEWRHPLTRAAAYAAATADERTRAHHSLAELPSQAPDRRAWHLARAAVGPDEAVAAELEMAAVRASQQGGFAEASDAMERSAELSVDSATRSRRLAETVALSIHVGQFGRIQELGRQVHELTDNKELLLLLDYGIAYALGYTTHQRSARLALVDVLERTWDHEVVMSWSSLTSLAALALRTGEGTETVAAWQRRLESVDRPVPWPVSEVNEAARAFVRTVGGGPSGRTLELVEQGRREVALGVDDPVDLAFNVEMLRGTVAWLVDDHEVAERRLALAAELMLSASAPAQLAQTLLALGQVRFEMGRWDGAEEAARLLADFTEARGLEFLSHTSVELKARVAVVRGDLARAHGLVKAIEAAVYPGEWASLTSALIRTKGLAALSAGDHAVAFTHLRMLFRDDGSPLHWHTSVLGLGDLALAAARTGRADEVVPLIDWASENVGELPSTRVAMTLARARANVSGADAGPSYEEAVTVAGGETWPFELATARLEYGVWLRRQRRRTDAQDQLRAALATFERLGTPTWAEQARAELRAAGVATGTPAPSSWSSLTAQERQVVRLAATGLSNREIGEALFLSPRTVGSHLHHAFPKLGVTTRGRLRDVVDDLAD